MIDLRCGDCLEEMKVIPDKSIDLVITDPPYWHKKSPGKPYSQRKQSKTKSKFAQSDLYNVNGLLMHNLSDFNGEQIEELLKCLSRIMKKMNAYIFCNDTQIAYYSMWAEQNKYMFSILVWEKPLSIINKNRYSQNTEYIIRIYEYGTALNRIEKNEYYNKVKKSKPINGKKKLHPTEKPVELINEIIELSSKENDIVLDCFMGSGSTGVACKKLNRSFIGIELDEKYFNIAKTRIENASNTKLNGNERV